MSRHIHGHSGAPALIRLRLACPRHHWIPDKARKYCYCCSRAFHTIFRRKHHCRMCGDIVCGKCSRTKVTLYNTLITRVERACNSCIHHSSTYYQTTPTHDRRLYTLNLLPAPPLPHDHHSTTASSSSLVRAEARTCRTFLASLSEKTWKDIMRARELVWNDACPVCLDTFEECTDMSTSGRNYSNHNRSKQKRHQDTSMNYRRSLVWKLPCQHAFHRECLRSWLDANYACPVCRAHLPRDITYVRKFVTY
jgi:hypothetical protein